LTLAAIFAADRPSQPKSSVIGPSVWRARARWAQGENSVFTLHYALRLTLPYALCCVTPSALRCAMPSHCATSIRPRSYVVLRPRGHSYKRRTAASFIHYGSTRSRVNIAVLYSIVRHIGHSVLMSSSASAPIQNFSTEFVKL